MATWGWGIHVFSCWPPLSGGSSSECQQNGIICPWDTYMGSQPFYYKESSFPPSFSEVFTSTVDLERPTFSMFFLVKSQMLKILPLSKCQTSIGFTVWSFVMWPLMVNQVLAASLSRADSVILDSGLIPAWTSTASKNESQLSTFCLLPLIGMQLWAEYLLRSTQDMAGRLWWVRHFLGSFSSGKVYKELHHNRCLVQKLLLEPFSGENKTQTLGREVWVWVIVPSLWNQVTLGRSLKPGHSNQVPLVFSSMKWVVEKL